MPSLTDLSLLLICTGLAVLFTWLTMLACRRLGVADRGGQVQRVHRHWAPRMGGVPVFLAAALGVIISHDLPERGEALILLACAIPAVLAGLSEDLRENLGARARLAATFLAAGLAWFALDAELRSVALPGFDWLLANVWLVAFAFTAFAVGGVAHSINIIDGFNGLSSFYSVICLVAFYVVGGFVGDDLVQHLSLIFGGALLGFLVWNFPYGRVFLGDCGAYFVGFALAELSVLLVARNPQVSPWFCFLLMAYPIWDTLFSSYRREVKRRMSWSDPDALHLHHLIYRRLVRPYESGHQHQRVVLNSMASMYVWGLGVMCAVPAVMFWDSTPMLGLFSFLFVLTYGLLYRRLVRFRAPRVLQFPPLRAGRRLDLADGSLPAE